MRKWLHEHRGHKVQWRFHPPFWMKGDPTHWACSCGKEWWT